jgi:hypothetical protein
VEQPSANAWPSGPDNAQVLSTCRLPRSREIATAPVPRFTPRETGYWR